MLPVLANVLKSVNQYFQYMYSHYKVAGCLHLGLELFSRNCQAFQCLSFWCVIDVLPFVLLLYLMYVFMRVLGGLSMWIRVWASILVGIFEVPPAVSQWKTLGCFGFCLYLNLSLGRSWDPSGPHFTGLSGLLLGLLKDYCYECPILLSSWSVGPCCLLTTLLKSIRVGLIIPTRTKI